MRIHDNIKKLAEEKGLSIYRIERDTGISNGAIGRWNESSPSTVNLMKVANYLGVSAEQLMKETEYEKEITK